MTDPETIKRRAGGRKRYNSERRRNADARREAISEVIRNWPMLPLMPRGAGNALAGASGVSPSTISRDLQCILFGGSVNNFVSDEELLYSVTRAYPGGPILSITDAAGYKIRGEERKRILRRLISRRAGLLRRL